jgi:hypothetical protein
MPHSTDRCIAPSRPRTHESEEVGSRLGPIWRSRGCVALEYSVFEVFTPTTQARINFVPRKQVNDQLVDALRTPGKQLIIYGESGSGKSTLLQKKLEELYSDHITSRCNSAMNFDQLLLDAFDQLERFYVEGRSTTFDSKVSASLASSFSRIRASINSERKESEGSSERRIVPPQLTPQRLGEFLGAQDLCWVIEDFHKMQPEHKRPLTQALKVFSDLGASFPSAKIIAVGATDTARQVVEYEPEMSNRVSELQVPLMNDQELREIVTNGQLLLNIDLSSVREPIVQYSIERSKRMSSTCAQYLLRRGYSRNRSTPDRLSKSRPQASPTEICTGVV